MTRADLIVRRDGQDIGLIKPLLGGGAEVFEIDRAGQLNYWTKAASPLEARDLLDAKYNSTRNRPAVADRQGRR
jgi:hypothetical protein